MHATIFFLPFTSVPSSGSITFYFYDQIQNQIIVILSFLLTSEKEALSASSNLLEVAKGLYKICVAQVQDFLCLILSKELILLKSHQATVSVSQGIMDVPSKET